MHRLEKERETKPGFSPVGAFAFSSPRGGSWRFRVFPSPFRPFEKGVALAFGKGRSGEQRIRHAHWMRPALEFGIQAYPDTCSAAKRIIGDDETIMSVKMRPCV